MSKIEDRIAELKWQISNLVVQGKEATAKRNRKRSIELAKECSIKLRELHQLTQDKKLLDLADRGDKLARLGECR